MEPTAMTLQSPQFWIIVALIVLAGGVSFMIFSFMSKALTTVATGPYDPAQTLTLSILAIVWALILFLGGIIITQIMTSPSGTASTESWSSFTFILGWATAKAGDIFNNRFGSTEQSRAKDDTIKQLARSGAALQDSFLDPNVVVTGTGSGTKAMLPATPAEPAATDAPAPGNMQTGTVNLTALNVNEGEIKPDPKKEP